MAQQRSLFDSDLRNMLKNGPRDRPLSRRHALFGATILAMIMLVATWLASRPDASIDEVDNSQVEYDPLRSQIAQVLNARKKTAVASSAALIPNKSVVPLGSSSASSADRGSGCAFL